MFDYRLPDASALRSADDAGVVAAIGACARVEAAAAARRLSGIAELVGRRADGPSDCAHWSCDNWDAIAAEVAAAPGVSHAMVEPVFTAWRHTHHLTHSQVLLRWFLLESG
jgi:hypothetical protein